METTREDTMISLLCRSTSMKLTPGATIEEAKGETNVMAEMRPRSIYFLPDSKLSGIAGSSWDSHPTSPESRSIIGSSSRGSFSFLERPDSAVATREMRDAVVATRWIAAP